jgi:hypothetical protein
MTAQPDILGNVVLSNGDLAVLAGNPYKNATYSGFDDLQVAILANSTPVALNQTTGNIGFPSGDSPNGSVSGDAGVQGDATQGGATIAALPGGGMAIMAWGDSNLNYTLQVLSNTGAVTTQPFVVHSQFTTAGNNANNAANPQGAVAAWSGGLVVAYSTDNESKDYYQRYTLAGVAVGSPVLVASTSDGSSTGWHGSMAVDSSGDVIFGFGAEDIYTPGAYKMFSSANAVLNTPDSVDKDSTIGATAVAGQELAPTFVPLPGGGFATVGYTPVGTYNVSAGNFPSFTMNVQTVSTAGAITTRDTVTHAVEDNYYQTASINWISVLPDGTVQFQEIRDNSYYHDANLADSYTVGGTLDRGSVTLPLPSDGNTPFSVSPATGPESNVVGVIVNSSNQLVGEGLSAATVAAPSITGISPDTGTSPTDGITDTGALTVNGIATAGTSIALFNGATQIGSTTAGSGGTWSIALGTALGQGSYSLTATASSGGTTSSASTGYAVTVDTTPPSVTSDNLVGSSPNNASSDQFTVTFSESVVGVSTSSFQLTDTGSVAGSIASVTGSGSSYTVTVTGVTGDGTMRLDLKGSGNGIEDTAGNVPAGYTSGQTYTIEDTPPPVISGTVAGQTTTDEATATPFAAVSITDSNANQIETITITLSHDGTSTDADGTLAGTGLSKSGIGTYELTTGTPSAVTTELDAWVFTPTAHQVAPGSSVTTTFTIQANDTAGGTSNNSTTTVGATAVNDPPVIAGAVAGQTTTDEATVTPFAGVAIGDVDFGQTETVTITLSNHLNGTLSNVGAGSYNSSTGVYSVTGTDSAVTTALDALVFTPTTHQVVPGSSVTTTFTIQATDTAGGTSRNSATTVIATAVNDPPVITGAGAGQTITDEATITPLSGVSVSDVDFGQTETVTITLSNHLNGTLSSSGGGSYDSTTGVYSVTGTDVAVTTAVDGVVFTPTAHQVAPGGTVATTFTIQATDTAGGTSSNSTTTVITTAVNDPPVVTGTVAGQTTTDEATITPLSGVSVSDIDLGQTETVTVTLSSAANGTLSDVDGGSFNRGTGVYSVTGTDGAVTTALDALVFTPTTHQVVPGSSVTTTFTIQATDTAGGTSRNSTTTVIATAVNDPPVITGAATGQLINDDQTDRPFSHVIISDPDLGANETVTITLNVDEIPSDANGTLSGAGLTKTGTGTYTLTAGTPAAVTAALRSLVFTPAALDLPPDSSAVTDMTVLVSDGVAASPTTDTTTSVAIVPCFAAGTRIATPRGAIPVERLCEGNTVLTVSGKPQRIQWIGCRTLDCNRHVSPERVKPIRIAPHAFGEDRPRRALLLSPDHSVFVEDVFIPIKHLVNGTTVTQIDVATVTYYHIELPRHDVVLAEGLPAETYLETGARFAFENGGGAMELHPDFAPDEARVGMVWRNFSYAPLIGTDGQVECVRARLAVQALMLGHQANGTPQRTKKARWTVMTRAPLSHPTDRWESAPQSRRQRSR